MSERSPKPDPITVFLGKTNSITPSLLFGSTNNICQKIETIQYPEDATVVPSPSVAQRLLTLLIEAIVIVPPLRLQLAISLLSLFVEDLNRLLRLEPPLVCKEVFAWASAVGQSIVVAETSRVPH
jgi:hypothetical protein